MNQTPVVRWSARLFLAAFWGVAAYVGVAVFGSMLTELYGSPPKRLADMQPLDDLSRRERTWCIGRLVGLKNQLDRRVASAVEGRETHRDTVARWLSWQTPWLAELDDAKQRCHSSSDAAVRDAYAQLLELHNGYNLAIVTLSRARNEGVDRLRQTLPELVHLPAH